MQTEIKKTKLENKTVWQWQVFNGAEIIAGGLCATKSDAQNDSSIYAANKKINSAEIKAGMQLIYNDGRAGHTNAVCEVLSVNKFSMCVQFFDRADTDTIKFNDAAWMNFLSIKTN